MPEGILADLLVQYGYVALVPAIILFGPLAALLGGVFARFDFFEFPIVYGVLIAGALVGDLMWYYAGYHWGESFADKFGRHVGITRAHVEKAKSLFHKHHSPIIFFTKITNAFGLMIPVLFTAGLAKIALWRYVLLNVAGEAIWTGVLLCIGYFFGDLWIRIDDVLGRTTLVGAFVLFLLLAFGVGKYVRTRMYES